MTLLLGDGGGAAAVPVGVGAPQRRAGAAPRVGVGSRGAGGRGARHGEAVQVDPMRPMLKAPGTKRLKL